MNEAEWLSCSVPERLLAWLLEVTDSVYGFPAEHGRRPSDRKLCLFVCSVSRLLPHPTRRALEAIDTAERWADGGPAPLPSTMEWLVLQGMSVQAIGDMLEYVANLHITERRPSGQMMAGLLRDIVGNPFRPAVATQHYQLDDGWGVKDRRPLPWLTPTVLSLARAAYDERPGRECSCVESARQYGTRSIRCTCCHGTGKIEDGALDPVRLAILADALEEAGCVDKDLLWHLRGKKRCPDCGGMGTRLRTVQDMKRSDGFKTRMVNGMCGASVARGCEGQGWVPISGAMHVRGCWAVDTLLGLE